jgi:hypothetical protein
MLLQLASPEADWATSAPELRRALFALEVLLRVHLTAEQEVLAGFPAPAQPGKAG